MKPRTAPRIGIVDALTAGLAMTSRRLWLLIIPAAIDLGVWLAPRLSVNHLTQKFLALWEALVRASYPSGQLAAMADMMTVIRGGMTQLGGEINLAEAITGSWLGAPSALVTEQSTRQTFISDMLLAPLGLSLPLPRIAPAPWQPAPIEVNNVWAVLLIVTALWLIGQLLVALYYRQCSIPSAEENRARGHALNLARSRGELSQHQQPALGRNAGLQDSPEGLAGDLRQGEDTSSSSEQSGQALTDPPTGKGQGDSLRWVGVRGFLGLATRLTLFSLVLGLAVLVLRLPLGVAMTLMLLSSNAAAGVFFALIGGMTLWALLWFLISFYFVSEAVLLDHRPLWRSAFQSLAMIRGRGLSVLGLVLTINVVMLGFRAVWGLIGRTPVGAIVAILGNAFLATSMLLAIFVYYADLRRQFETHLAQAQGDLARRNQR